MKTTTYGDILNLAAELAERTRDNLPTSEATMLRAFFAAEMPELWNREAWPELCDNLEQVTLDTNKCFSLREGEASEMGDILCLLDADPRTTTVVNRLTEFTRLDNRVNVTSTQSAVWVDWQDPAPDLLDDTTVGATLADYELPARFKLPLAYKGAAHLIRSEDPTLALLYSNLADAELLKQTSRLTVPYWRATRGKQ